MDAVHHLINAATADNLSVLLEECLPELLQLQGEVLKTKRAEDVPLPPLAKAVKALLPLASGSFQNVTGLTVRAAASVRTVCILFTLSLEFHKENKDSQLISKLKKSGLVAVLPSTCSALADAITKQNLMFKQQQKLQQSSKQPNNGKKPNHSSSQHNSSSQTASSDSYATSESLYLIAAAALQTWRCCTAIWDEPSLVTQQVTHTIAPITKLVLAVLHTASDSSSDSPGSNADGSKEVTFKPCSHAVDMAAEAAYAMALLVSRMSFQMSSGPPGFRQLLKLAPEVASDQILHLLCISFASVLMLNRQQRATAAADDNGVADPAAAAGEADPNTSSRSRLAAAPEHHNNLLNLLGCSSLLRYGSKSTEPYADKIYLVPYSIYYCLAMRQEEALIRIGAPDGGFGFVKPDWKVQLQDPSESVPGKLWLPLARLCVEAFWLLEHRNVCFEVMRLLYKACYYRQYFYKEITSEILDLLLSEAGPAVVGLAGERLPRDKTSDSWRAFDYFSDLLMRTLGQEALNKGIKQNLSNAFKQQPQSTCIVLEAAMRQTSISDEPAVPLDVLLPLANAIGCAATPHAQQYLPVATADAATGSAPASPSAAHVFSLLLTCTKLALINKHDVHMRNVTKLVQVAMLLTHVSERWTIVPELLRAAVEIKTPEGFKNSIRVWVPNSGSGSFMLCKAADSNSGSSCKNDKVTLDVTAIAPVLHLIGHSLYCLGEVLEAGHSLECLQQTGHCYLAPQDMMGFPQDTLLWLKRVLEIVSLAAQAPEQQGTQVPAHNNSTVPQQLLTTKLLQQLQAKHQQAAAAMNAAIAAWQVGAEMGETHGAFRGNSEGSKVLQQIHVADAAMQQKLKELGAAIAAAVPVVWCCNNAACVRFKRLSERMVKGVCSKCKAARYCCIECQEAHWKLHRPVCKILRGN